MSGNLKGKCGIVFNLGQRWCFGKRVGTALACMVLMLMLCTSAQAGISSGFHSADTNLDYRISLSELLRLIQFYNSAGYHCDLATQDGYAPGPGDQSCVPHDSDYSPQDWKIGLAELLRLIQFYNSGGYHLQRGTGDGFGPGLEPALQACFPALYSADDLTGRALRVSPSQYKVAVFIRTGGWYNKPSAGAPDTPLQTDGSWTCDVTTGTGGASASEIAAFLVPASFAIPVANGDAGIPQSVRDNAIASIRDERQTAPSSTATLAVCAPALATEDNLTGQVFNVAPADYQIAVFIFTSGWYNKPYWDPRLTPIAADGTWNCDVTTGIGDQAASKIAAFIVPNGYMPPQLGNAYAIPDEVYQQAVASAVVARREPRMIQFAGREWMVKENPLPVGPPLAGNYFSADPANVWVDVQGRLHLRITERHGRWYCAEIFCAESLGYGTYNFTTDSDLAALDKNVVLGLFTYDDTIPTPNRELDIEFSQWGESGADNAQFVVQPWDVDGNRHRFMFPAGSARSTHSMAWQAGQVSFESDQGSTPINSWTYTGAGVPTPGAEKTRMNLWIVGGSTQPPPAEAEVVISDFTWKPPSDYSVERLQQGGNTEYRCHFKENHFLTVIDSDGAFALRPHPGQDVNGWGSSWYAQPFLPGATLSQTTIQSVVPEGNGVRVVASGNVCQGTSSSYGTWSASLLLSDDPEHKKVSGSGEYAITLAGLLDPGTGDLNLYKIASNYLDDVPLLPTGSGTGDTGDMARAEALGTTFNYTWIPEDVPSFFPTDTTDGLSINVIGQYNHVDTAAMGYAPIEPAYKPGLKVILTSQIPGAGITFGALYNVSQAQCFYCDNVGITPLIRVGSPNTEFHFNVAFESEALPGDGGTAASISHKTTQ